MHVRVADVLDATAFLPLPSSAADHAIALVAPSQLRERPAGAFPLTNSPRLHRWHGLRPLSRRYRLHSMISTSAPDLLVARASLTSPAARRAGYKATQHP